MPANSLQQALQDFANANGGTSSPAYIQLTQAINASPELQDQLETAFSTGQLSDFKAVTDGPGAAYFNSSDDTLNLLVSNGNIVDTQGSLTAINSGVLTFIVGHETDHSYNSETVQIASNNFDQGVASLKAQGTNQDYTSLIQTYDNAHANDEASAQLAGFNAVASSVLNQNPSATLQDIRNAMGGYSTFFFNADGSLISGLQLNSQTMQITPTDPGSIQTEVNTYYDSSAALNENGTTVDYRNYNGAAELGQLSADLNSSGGVSSEAQINYNQLNWNANQITAGLKSDFANDPSPSGITVSNTTTGSLDTYFHNSYGANVEVDSTTGSQTVYSYQNNSIVTVTNGVINIARGILNDTVAGDNDQVNVSDGDNVTIINDGIGHADNVYVGDSAISLASSDTSIAVWGTQDSLYNASGVTGGIATLDGGSGALLFNSILSGQINAGANEQSIYNSGNNDTLNAGAYTGDVFTLGSNQTDYIYGSNEQIAGQAGDRIVDYGNNNVIDANGATVTDEGYGDMTYGNDDTVYGNGTGDGVMGTGDMGGTGYTGGGGGGPTGGTGGTTGGTTYYGSSGFDAGSRQGKVNTISSYDLAHGFTKAADAADAAWARTSKVINAALGLGATDLSATATVPSARVPSPLATARWGSSTVTWSFAGGSTSGADPISGAIQEQYQAAVEQAFKTWAAASGITFDEVAGGAKSDITVGWGALGSSVSGLLGYTAATTRGGILQPGATIRLEDPSEDALIADASGSYTYSGTTTTLEQLVLHEIGHTLGLAESSNINSIMFPELSANNTALSASDIQNIEILYPQTSPVAGAGTTAMAQAMASFSAQEPAANTTNDHVYARTFAPAIAIPLA